MKISPDFTPYIVKKWTSLMQTEYLFRFENDYGVMIVESRHLDLHQKKISRVIANDIYVIRFREDGFWNYDFEKTHRAGSEFLGGKSIDDILQEVKNLPSQKECETC